MARPSRLGRYELHRRIGVGGMSELYLARYQQAAEVERTCVVKRLLPDLAQQPQMVAMFLDEARINLLLDHPNLVSVFDVGHAGGEYYMAMEYVGGRDLRWVLGACARAGGRLFPRLALYVARELLKALDHAHHARSSDGTHLQIVHRDVSPENVLVDRHGAVKLSDFGAARSILSSFPARQGEALGKVPYMAPETLDRGQSNAASDLFSLNLLLFEAVAGRPLLRADSADEALRFWRDFEPTLAIPRAVSLADGGAILVRGLERDPSRRYEDAAAQLREVQELLLRRWGGVSPGDLGEFVRQLEGASEESGRVVTAPVDLPSMPGMAAAAGRQWFGFSDGQLRGPHDGDTARRRAEEARGAATLACPPGQYWRPASELWSLPRIEARGASCLQLGPSLRSLGGDPWRVTLWRKQQVVSLDLVRSRIVRAIRFHPLAGEPVELVPGAGGGDPADPWRGLVEAGMIDARAVFALQRRELRRFLAMPMEWDEMWVLVEPLQRPRSGGVELATALVDAAHDTRGDRQIGRLLLTSGGRAMRVAVDHLPPELDAALYKLEHEVLAEVRGGASLSALLRRHQVDRRALFAALFTLHQAGIVDLG
jgi:hypothetical protein